MSEENFEIPEHLLKRSAEAKAEALGLPVEQVLEEMKSGKPAAKAAVSYTHLTLPTIE